MVNKGIGDGHALKEINHTTENKIKGNTYPVSLRPLMEIMKESKKPGNMKILTPKFP